MAVVWVARLTDEEEERSDAAIRDQMYDDLEIIWEQMKEEKLKERGAT